MVVGGFRDEVAQKTARQLVLYNCRSGGQSQFSGSLLDIKGAKRPLRTAVRSLGARASRCAAHGRGLGRAGRHGVSRHFTRALHRRDRLDAVEGGRALADRGARQRVQSSSEAIERVAQLHGFRDPERMRRAFIRALRPAAAIKRAARRGRQLPVRCSG